MSYLDYDSHLEGTNNPARQYTAKSTTQESIENYDGAPGASPFAEGNVQKTNDDKCADSNTNEVLSENPSTKTEENRTRIRIHPVNKRKIIPRIITKQDKTIQ